MINGFLNIIIELGLIGVGLAIILFGLNFLLTTLVVGGVGLVALFGWLKKKWQQFMEWK